jgi:hypothetical protein
MPAIQRDIRDEVGQLVITATQDVEPILDYAKAARSDGTRGYTPSRDMRRVAVIPLVIAEKWKNELGVDVFNKDHQRKVAALLNDPDWAYLRTCDGRVGGRVG